MENFIIYLALCMFPLLLALFLIMEWKDVDLDIQNVADYYEFRNQKWWESGAAYEKYVKEEMIKIRTNRLMRQVHRRIK